MYYLVVWIRPKSTEYTSSFKAGLGCGRLNWFTILRITQTAINTEQKNNQTKNKARTGVALETDLMNNDINVCVVVRETSQTRKGRGSRQYSSFIQSPRGLGSSRCYRNKGGVGVYAQNKNLVIDVFHSESFSLTGVTLLLRMAFSLSVSNRLQSKVWEIWTYGVH